MGIVALILLSVTVGWSAFTGGFEAFTGTRGPVHHYWFESGRALKRMYEYQPPERKSVMVDITGMSHHTADGTQPTKRDRSRPFPRLDVAPAVLPEVTIVSNAAPLSQFQVEQTPLPTAPPSVVQKPLTPIAPKPVREISLGRMVQTAIKSDSHLSRAANITIRATTNKNRVILHGIVTEAQEKKYIGDLAQGIAGAGNVDNEIIVL